MNTCAICQIIENDEELEGEEDMKVNYVYKRIRDYLDSINPSSETPSKSFPRVISRRLADYVNRHFVGNSSRPDIIIDPATPEMIRVHCLRHTDAPKVKMLNLLCQLITQEEALIQQQQPVVPLSKIRALITSMKDIIVSLK